MELEEGKTYRIDLEGLSTDAGTLLDPFLGGVYDANGALLAQSADFDGGEGWNSRLIFTAAETATHYIEAENYRGLGTYTLSVTDISDEVTDDFAFGTGTSGTVSVDGSVTGEIEHARDQDWFAVELEADKTYRIDLEGNWSSAGTLLDPHLRGVYDSDGALLPGTEDANGGMIYNSRVTFTATATETHYVAASAAYDIYAGARGGPTGSRFTTSRTEARTSSPPEPTRPAR